MSELNYKDWKKQNTIYLPAGFTNANVLCLKKTGAEISNKELKSLYSSYLIINDRMKLELKHITPYLPYKLRANIVNKEVDEQIYNDALIGFQDKEIYFDKADVFILDNTDGYVQLILRPLSDLTKEIEVNGVKLIPIDFFKTESPYNFSMEFVYGNLKIINNLKSLAIDGYYFDINFLPYAVVKKLLEWHFDIYDLIYNKLAVSIHDVEEVIA